MTTREESQARIERWADALEPALRVAVLKAWMDLRGVSLSELVRRIEARDLDGALRLLFDSAEGRAALAKVRATYQRGLVATAEKATRAINRGTRA